MVNLSDPDKTIIVQLCKGQCALSVVSGYKRFAKFNLLELSQKVQICHLAHSYIKDCFPDTQACWPACSGRTWQQHVIRLRARSLLPMVTSPIA